MVGAPIIGDNVYIAPGVKIYGNIKIPNNCAIGANSVVNRSIIEENMLIAGVPAQTIKNINIKQIIKHLD
jgi:serine O-acetyltransferase